MPTSGQTRSRLVLVQLLTLFVLGWGGAERAPAQGRPSGAAAFKPESLSLFDRQKAELLLRTRYPCLGCHEIAGSGGRIGPALTGVGSRRSAAYVYEMISDPQSTVPGTVMPRVTMPVKTQELIASYLIEGASAPAASATKAAPPGPPIASPTPTGDDARALYARRCAPCHGSEGRGDGPNAAYLPVRPTAHASSEAMARRSDDALFDTIFAGGYIMNRSNLMPPFGATLTRPQILGLVRYIRTLCRCEGPAWSREPQPR